MKFPGILPVNTLRVVRRNSSTLHVAVRAHTIPVVVHLHTAQIGVPVVGGGVQVSKEGETGDTVAVYSVQGVRVSAPLSFG